MILKLVDVNIEGNKHLDRLIPFLKTESPDIICLQEVFGVDIPLFEKELSMKSHFFPLLTVTQPNPWGFPLGGQTGLGFLSRLPFLSVDHQYYRGKPGPLPEMHDNPDAQNLVLACAKVKKDNQLYTVCTTHFTWAMPEDADAKQAPYLVKLLNILDPIKEFILAGDFNAPRGLKTFNTLAAKYKDNIPLEIDSTLDHELHRAKDRKLVVDGLFTTPEYRVKNIKIESGVSDHKAIVAEIDKI